MSKSYIDTVVQFIIPRMATVLKAKGLPIGVEEVTLDDKVALYPNPAKDAFYVKSMDVQKADRIVILNMNGQSVKTFGSTEFSESIDISDISPGIYFVAIHTESGTAVKKLNIQ